MKLTEKITARYTWRVWFLPWYVIVVAVAILTIVGGPFLDHVAYHLLAGFCAGAALGLGAMQATKLLSEIRMERLRMYLPAQMEMLDDSDDGPVISVTRGSGENVIVTMPPGYNPGQDGGLAIAVMVCPKMPKPLREAWERQAVEIGLRRLMDRDE